MKTIFKFIPLFLTFTLVSCNGSHIENTNSVSDSIYNSGSDTESTPVDKPTEVTIFSINDVHGSLTEFPYGNELGLAKLDFAIKNDPDYDPETSVLLSCGDSWQGGYLAHEEKQVTDQLFDMMGMDAMVLGNHEFDWGIQNIENLKAQSNFPFLGANIYDSQGNYADNIVDPSCVIEKIGVKIGVVGSMGPYEESSIAPGPLAGYTFSYDIGLIENEAKKLHEQGCDIVVLACHDSAFNSSDYLTTIGSMISRDIINGIFGAHTHQFESSTIGNNKIPYVQAGSNSKGYAKIKFDVASKKAIEWKYYECYQEFHNIPVELLNPNMVSLINEKSAEHQGLDELCKFDGDFRRYHELNRFVPMGMYEVAEKRGWKSQNHLIGLHNAAGIRSDVPSGSVTKEKLFKTSPFENKVQVITGIPGNKLKKLMGDIIDNHSSGYISGSRINTYYIYYLENDEVFSPDYTYDVITIDYVTSSSYWKNAGLGAYPCYELDKENQSVIYMFDCLVEFINDYKLINNTDVFYSSDFR